MTLRRCLAFALIAGITGAFIGRAFPHDAPSVQAAPSASSVDLAGAPADRACEAERADFAATKAQLDICMAFRARVPEANPSGAPELLRPDHPAESGALGPRLPSPEEIRRNRELLDSYPEAVIVQHHDGTTGVYKPDEWPIDGDGVIVARKLPDGTLGWYAGPDAGPRSDPAAFRPWEPQINPLPVWRRAPDGTIMIDGKPASPSVQFMFGGKTEESVEPQR
ncbi:hypothetical protein [Sorangium sp. So ce131]|uniref:hypothetical protein n=1 Tax=Sorangium sp. So ce131 TaxID=3133282 RepID=UPI003F61FD55